jgi:hypothetical protein
MRIGAALTVTLNLPYQWIAAANLTEGPPRDRHHRARPEGHTRISYFVCWPHVRPWVLRRTQPALRCIPDAEKVAAILGAAARTRIAEVEAPAAGPPPTRSPPNRSVAMTQPPCHRPGPRTEDPARPAARRSSPWCFSASPSRPSPGVTGMPPAAMPPTTARRWSPSA